MICRLQKIYSLLDNATIPCNLLQICDDRCKISTFLFFFVCTASFIIASKSSRSGSFAKVVEKPKKKKNIIVIQDNNNLFLMKNYLGSIFIYVCFSVIPGPNWVYYIFCNIQPKFWNCQCYFSLEVHFGPFYGPRWLFHWSL